MAIFKGNPSGSPSKNGMTVISDQNYNVDLEIPWGSLASTQQLYGDMPMMTCIGYAQGILMISYLL